MQNYLCEKYMHVVILNDKSDKRQDKGMSVQTKMRQHYDSQLFHLWLHSLIRR